mgnify:CR=1 FL=1
MGAYVLSRSATVLCPHGGVIIHVPVMHRVYKVLGEPVMLVNDTYNVAGCVMLYRPCMSVIWVSPSTLLYVRGVPALVHTSIGLVTSAAEAPSGPAMITTFQTQVMEPTTFTNES